MALDKYIVQVFPILCKGRDIVGNETLKDPVEVEIKIYQSIGNNSTISSEVKCPYNTGGHGQRCKASHPEFDKIERSIFCPYSFDLPYALEGKRGRP